jgi:hypothetical protein
MPIKVTCPKCQGVLHAPDDAGGKRGKCPTCGNVLSIPAAGGGGSMIPPEPDSLAPTPFNAAPQPRAPSPFGNPPEDARRSSFASGLTSPPPVAPVSLPPEARKPVQPRASSMSFGANPNEPRKPNDPFVKTGKTPATESAQLSKSWARARRGLWYVQAGYFFALVAVLGVAGLMIAELAGVKLPDKPSILKIEEWKMANEIRYAAFVIPALLALLLMTLGRMGAASAPSASYAKGLFQASALTTLLTTLGITAFLAMMVSSMMNGYAPKLLLADDAPGMIQRIGMAIAAVCAPLAELWFVVALGRMGAGLHNTRLAARGTRFLILAGLIFIVVGIGSYGWSYYHGQIEETFKTQVLPKLEKLGDKQAMILPGLAILAALFVWLLYVRLVGAARRAIYEWLDVNRG